MQQRFSSCFQVHSACLSALVDTKYPIEQAKHSQSTNTVKGHISKMLNKNNEKCDCIECENYEVEYDGI